MRPRNRSISRPIVLTSVAFALNVAIIVGWILVVLDVMQEGQGTWLLVLGLVSLAFVSAVLLISGVSLAREIIEGRRQTTFIDSVTHELKSPLASLLLGLETLSREDLPAERREEVHEMMRQDVQRLGAFIDDILETSRAAGRARPRSDELVELAELVDRCVQRVGARYGLPDGDEIEVRVEPDLVVRTDPTAMETVVRNLVDNAVKYSASPRSIVIEATLEPKQLRLEVRDRGIGIAKADLAKVFQRFYRAGGEDVRSRYGTGLGLYVVSQLVRGLGGRMEVDSAGLGEGTTMRVVLPQKESA